MGATRLVSESFRQLRESESSIHNGSNIRGIERGHVVLLIAAACYDRPAHALGLAASGFAMPEWDAVCCGAVEAAAALARLLLATLVLLFGYQGEQRLRSCRDSSHGREKFR